MRHALDLRPRDEPVLVAVREAILTLADEYEMQKDLRLLQARLAATYPSVSAFSRAVVQLQWEREIIEALAHRLGVDPLVDPRPEILAGAAMSALRAAIRRWTYSGGTDDLPDLVAEAFDALGELASGELAVSRQPPSSERSVTGARRARRARRSPSCSKETGSRHSPRCSRARTRSGPGSTVTSSRRNPGW